MVPQSEPYFEPTFLWSTLLGNRMGCPQVTADLMWVGATLLPWFSIAVMANRHGLCNVVVCTFGEAMRSQGRKPGWNFMRGTRGVRGTLWIIDADARIRMACRRHMYEYGTTSEQLGAIAITCRKHASMNKQCPAAHAYNHEGVPCLQNVCRSLRLLRYLPGDRWWGCCGGYLSERPGSHACALRTYRGMETATRYRRRVVSQHDHNRSGRIPPRMAFEMAAVLRRI